MIKFALAILFAVSSSAFAQTQAKVETFSVEGVRGVRDDSTYLIINGNPNNSVYCTEKVSTLTLFADYYETSYLYLFIDYDTCLKIKEKAVHSTKERPSLLTVTSDNQVTIE